MEAGDLIGGAFITLFFVGVFAFSISGLFLNNIGASDGQHNGVVTAVEFNKNILWDSTLVYFKTDAQSTQEDIYCVNDQNLKLKLEKYSNERTRVTIKYQNPFLLWRAQCNGGNSIIYDVQED